MVEELQVYKWKKYLIILMFFTLFSCSFDNQTGLWNQKINKIQLSNVDLNDLDDDKSFEEYKKEQMDRNARHQEAARSHPKFPK